MGRSRNEINMELNIKVVKGDAVPDDVLLEDAKNGDRFAQIRLEAYGARDFIHGYDDGEVMEPKYTE